MFQRALHLRVAQTHIPVHHRLDTEHSRAHPCARVPSSSSVYGRTDRPSPVPRATSDGPGAPGRSLRVDLSTEGEERGNKADANHCSGAGHMMADAPEQCQEGADAAPAQRHELGHGLVAQFRYLCVRATGGQGGRMRSKSIPPCLGAAAAAPSRRLHGDAPQRKGTDATRLVQRDGNEQAYQKRAARVSAVGIGWNAGRRSQQTAQRRAVERAQQAGSAIRWCVCGAPYAPRAWLSSPSKCAAAVSSNEQPGTGDDGRRN